MLLPVPNANGHNTLRTAPHRATPTTHSPCTYSFLELNALGSRFTQNWYICSSSYVAALWRSMSVCVCVCVCEDRRWFYGRWNVQCVK